jgi:hypothetical protein
MTRNELELLLSALITGQIFVEEAMALQSNHTDHGFKLGYLQKELNTINRAIRIVRNALCIGGAQ